jgi:NAD(P)-dependent dehydrogenase (short-subunit alcohol dehydrogenase family)
MANQLCRTSVPRGTRVLVVGAGSTHLGRRIAQALLTQLDVVAATESGSGQRKNDGMQPLEVPIVRQQPGIEPALVEDFQQGDRTPPHGWYQQFAGRRGRPPRF